MRHLTLVDLFLLIIGIVSILFLYNTYKAEVLYFTQMYQKQMIRLFISNFVLYRYVLQFVLYNMLYQDSIGKVDENLVQHYNIGIFGLIGSRKSANGVAITQMAEGILRNDLQRRLYKINLFLGKYIDFVDLNNYFEKEFPWTVVHTDYMRKQFVLSYLRSRSISFAVISFKVKDNSFSKESAITLLGEYVELRYYEFFRDNYIQANTSIQSVNTGHMCLPMKESQFQIYRPNDRAYERFQITLKDEAAIVDNSRVNSRNDKDSVKDNDDGKDVENVTQRHFGKGKNFRITIAQSEKDVTANRRRLFNRSLELYKPQDIFLFQFEMNIVKRLAIHLMNRESKKETRKIRKANIIYYINKILRIKLLEKYSVWLINKYYYYSIQYNNYKKVLLLLEKLHIYLGKFLYCVQPMFIHDDVSNIGKNPSFLMESGKSFPMFIVYPAGISFGKYATHSYFRIIDERNALATVPMAIVKPFKKMIMSKEEHLSMGFKAINRIYDEIGNPEEGIDNKNTKERTHNVKELPGEANLTMFE